MPAEQQPPRRGRAWPIDPTVNLGHVLIVIGMVVSVFLAYLELRETDIDHETRIKSIERTLEYTDSRRRQFETEIRVTLGQILQDLAVLKDARERAHR